MGIQHVGAGRNYEEAHRPAVIDHLGLRTAFLAYTEIDAPGCDLVKYASAESPGVARLSIPEVISDIRKCRQLADIVVVSLHWGDPPLHYPHPSQVLAAQGLIQAGASLIVGHHGHILQGIHRSGSSIAAFDLGNFVFPEFYLTSDNVLSLEETANRWVWKPWSRAAALIDSVLSEDGVEQYAAVPLVHRGPHGSVEIPRSVEKWRLIRQLAFWSSLLADPEYEKTYERLRTLPVTDHGGLLRGILSRLRDEGVVAVARRILEVLREWRALYVKHGRGPIRGMVASETGEIEPPVPVGKDLSTEEW